MPSCNPVYAILMDEAPRMSDDVLDAQISDIELTLAALRKEKRSRTPVASSGFFRKRDIVLKADDWDEVSTQVGLEDSDFRFDFDQE